MTAFKSLFIDKFLSVWWVVVTLMLALPFAVWAGKLALAPATSDTCQDFGTRQVCVLSIRRSAQRFWEYRTVLSVDGRKQALELYNCRDRIRISPKDGSTIPFLTGKVGDWVCHLTEPERPASLSERTTVQIR